VEFREHRPYVQGDDLRDLDWNVFLRLEQLAVKEYGRDASPDVAIILDRSASMGEEGGGKDRIAREIAGGVAYLSLVAGSPVTVFLAGPGGPNPVGRYRSPRKVDALLSMLEGLGRPEGETWLGAVTRLPPASAQGRIAFVISDFLQEPFPAALGPALAAGPGSGWLVHIVAEAERHPLLDAPRTLLDPETGRRLATGDPRPLLEAYFAELAAHEETVREHARRHGLGGVLASDAAPFEDAIGRCIGRRGAVP
jgi:uncharacterized protein (DUF58 family)